MRLKKPKFWLIFVFLSITTVWLVFSKGNPDDRKDIIKFSHKYHLIEIEASCSDCHAKANESTLASDNLLTTKEACAECHDVEDEENCTLCHFENEETRIAFENPKRELVFSHKFHIEDAKLACETCHGNLNEVDFANAKSMPAMEDCSSCHNNQQATLECGTCHTNTLNLRPVDHSADFLMSELYISSMNSKSFESV